MVSTCLYSRRLAPSSVSETAIVMIMAIVMVTFRQSPVATSERTYFRRMVVGDPSRGCSAGRGRQDRGRRSAVDTAGLVADDLAALDLNHTPAHLVHDVGVVRDHDDRGTRPIDAVEQPHD